MRGTHRSGTSGHDPYYRPLGRLLTLDLQENVPQGRGVLVGARIRITKRDTLGVVTAISVRLDDEALRALAQLEATGISRSEAIRRAIVDSASRQQRRHLLAAEVAALESDEADRQEMLEVAGLMESLRASR